MPNLHIPKTLFVLLGVVGLVLVGLVAYMAGRYTQPTPVEYINANEDAEEVADDVEEGDVKEDIVSNTNTTTNTNSQRMAVGEGGVTWLAEPEKLEDLNLMLYSSGYDVYYRVGTLADGSSIIYMYREELGYIINRFRENVDGSYVLLGNHSADHIADDPTAYLAEDVTVDTETVYSELDYPDTLTVNGLPLELYTFGLNSYTIESELSEPDRNALVEFGTSDYGTVYELPSTQETIYDNGSIIAKKYLLVLADSSVVSFVTAQPFFSDDDSVQATWESGYSDFADRTYLRGIVVGGCGVLGGNQYVADMTPEAMVVVGTTDDGDTLYTILDDDSSLLRNAYESYKVGRDYEGSTVEIISYEDFTAATPLLIWQDAVGDYILYLDSAYAPAVECGKPVLYLYPTQPTQVSVKVGANVTVSEPAYNGGWNVLAQPTGTELFWEGKGWGTYPQVTTGKVVARAAVEATIRQDLATMSFNEGEIQDFVEFWMPHMPNTPYVRLTWFDTKQMNVLAPVSIQPRPDTLVRVFLDFAGQQTGDTNLAPQTLYPTVRKGFTVMEWGGLLLGR